MTNKYFGLATLALTSIFNIATAQAYEPSWEGNHADAKSEAWTWMGHIQELTGKGASLALGHKGIGFIYYYTRNDTGNEGSLNFRSSAITTTVDGEGQAYDTHTVYLSQHPGSQLRVRTGTAVDLTFQADKMSDSVKTLPMTTKDTTKLNQVMALYPGLTIAPGFVPTKTHLHEMEEDGTTLDLDFYAIWPALAPEGGLVRFLGQSGTYEFASPMLVTIGTYKGKAMAGLSFLDRQWAAQYFGQNVMSNISDFLQPNHALPFSHSWSAFHAYNERTHDWTFFHLWHQFSRVDTGAPDQLTDYSDLLWMTNGQAQGHIKSSDYTWVSSGWVQWGGREVLLDYADGHTSFFPSRADYTVPSLNFKGRMTAFPALQALNQPIPFYEGYASGEATWNGDTVRLQGRLESSRLMFRPQDYKEILSTLQTQEGDWQQKDLQAWLKQQLRMPASANPTFSDYLSNIISLLGNIDLKLAVLGEILSDNGVSVDPTDASYSIYR